MAMPAPVAGCTFARCWFAGRRRQRRQAGHCKQKLVCGIEQIQVRIDGAIGGGQEDGGPLRAIDGDVGFKSRSSAGLLDDVRRRIGGQDVNPTESDAGRLAGMVEPSLADQAGRSQIDGLSRGILRGNCRATGSQQVFELNRFTKEERLFAG
jgi:hypothetical protein